MVIKNGFFRFISNGLIALLYYLIVGWWTPIYAAVPEAVPEAVPLLETTHFELLGTRKGTLALDIKAYEMRQYENGNIILTGGIEIILLNNSTDKEEGPTHIQADRLSYNKEEGLCMIAGNVLVSKPQQQLSITTEQLWYDMEQEILFTEVPIVITNKENVLKGSGLRATKDLTKYTVTGPTGTVEVQQEAVLGG